MTGRVQEAPVFEVVPRVIRFEDVDERFYVAAVRVTSANPGFTSSHDLLPGGYTTPDTANAIAETMLKDPEMRHRVLCDHEDARSRLSGAVRLPKVDCDLLGAMADAREATQRLAASRQSWNLPLRWWRAWRFRVAVRRVNRLSRDALRIST